jgi:hypothetical protein
VTNGIATGSGPNVGSQVMRQPVPAIALVARDVFDSVEREVRGIVRQADGDQEQALKIALQRLAEAGDISDGDLRRLSRVTELVIEAERDRGRETEAAAEIRRIRREALDDPRSTPFALTAMSMATSSDDPALTIAAWGMVGLIVGGVAGAAIGGALGGPGGAEVGFGWGAAIGAVVGGIIGGICAAE